MTVENMDAFLASLGVHTFNYAVRSGIALTSKYAVQQCSRLLKTVNDRAVFEELRSLQRLLNSRIKVLSPAIDLIELKSGRGNPFLESAVPLAKSLHREIVRLGKRLEDAAAAEEEAPGAGAKTRSRTGAHHAELLLIISEIKDLLARIDRDIPLLQLAITGSDEKMSTTLTPGISPSRLTQASHLLWSGDMQFAADPTRPVQIGTTFTLSLYMLFLGHSPADANQGKFDTPSSSSLGSEWKGTVSPDDTRYGVGKGERRPIWQEVMHKARVRLCRTPVGWSFDPAKGYIPKGPSNTKIIETGSRTSVAAFLGDSAEYSYHLEMVEDLDDGRLHEGDGPLLGQFSGMPMAGVRESVPIYEVSRIFYTDTGRILNIGSADDAENNPVLLLKRDVGAKSPIKLRQEWFEEPAEPQDDDEVDSSLSSDQEEVDRQLWGESALSTPSPRQPDGPQTGSLPAHLDPEWLALEVYIEDDNRSGSDSSSELDEGEDGEDGETKSNGAVIPAKQGAPARRPRLSLDSSLATQLDKISMKPRPSLSLSDSKREVSGGLEPVVNSSPYGSVTSSLSLLEMLVRLASLQEFQQTPHMAVPDHIFTFFLEETSTTGLRGEAQWQARNEARRRVGFDPYTDTPSR